MMEQYLEIKAANPGLLLFYRMGDFYELFFEDAEIASRDARHRADQTRQASGHGYPDVRRAGGALRGLSASPDRAGHRVAVCEQTEDPAAARARGNKSVVRRAVVRLVTPGTLTEDTLLDAKTNNYLLAIARARGVGRHATASGSPGSTSRPPNSSSRNARPANSPRRWRASIPTRRSSPTRCMAIPIWGRCCANCRR